MCGEFRGGATIALKHNTLFSAVTLEATRIPTPNLDQHCLVKKWAWILFANLPRDNIKSTEFSVAVARCIHSRLKSRSIRPNKGNGRNGFHFRKAELRPVFLRQAGPVMFSRLYRSRWNASQAICNSKTQSCTEKRIRPRARKYFGSCGCPRTTCNNKK